MRLILTDPDGDKLTVGNYEDDDTIDIEIAQGPRLNIVTLTRDQAEKLIENLISKRPTVSRTPKIDEAPGAKFLKTSDEKRAEIVRLVLDKRCSNRDAIRAELDRLDVDYASNLPTCFLDGFIKFLRSLES